MEPASIDIEWKVLRFQTFLINKYSDFFFLPILKYLEKYCLGADPVTPLWAV